MSSWGNSLAISAGVGGGGGGRSGKVDTGCAAGVPAWVGSAAARRQAGQSPSAASSGMARPHCGQVGVAECVAEGRVGVAGVDMVWGAPCAKRATGAYRCREEKSGRCYRVFSAGLRLEGRGCVVEPIGRRGFRRFVLPLFCTCHVLHHLHHLPRCFAIRWRHSASCARS